VSCLPGCVASFNVSPTLRACVHRLFILSDCWVVDLALAGQRLASAPDHVVRSCVHVPQRCKPFHVCLQIQAAGAALECYPDNVLVSFFVFPTARFHCADCAAGLPASCSAGYFCPAGSTNATAARCGVGTYCTSGSFQASQCPAGNCSTSMLRLLNRLLSL
jgi:hypothetical protein